MSREGKYIQLTEVDYYVATFAGEILPAEVTFEDFWKTKTSPLRLYLHTEDKYVSSAKLVAHIPLVCDFA